VAISRVEGLAVPEAADAIAVSLRDILVKYQTLGTEISRKLKYQTLGTEVKYQTLGTKIAEILLTSLSFLSSLRL
jgi:hypothetical protein